MPALDILRRCTILMGSAPGEPPSAGTAGAGLRLQAEGSVEMRAVVRGVLAAGLIAAVLGCPSVSRSSSGSPAIPVVPSLLAAPGEAPGLAGKPFLPCSLTDAERDFLRRNPSYLRTRMMSSTGRRVEGLFGAPAEFAPADGVIFAWQGYTSLLTRLIKFVAETDTAYVVVDSDYYASSARRQLEAAGVNMENVRFFSCCLDSVWMRDYGPWWIYTKDGDREIVDLIYNRPRPDDDKFPAWLGRKIGIPVHPTQLVLPGGNLILDGHGVAVMTDVVFDPSQGGDPSLTREDVERYMKEYFGCRKVIFLKHMNRDGTGHVDMFCKLLNDETVIVGEYADASDGAPGNKEILDENAAILAAETNGLGRKFKVVRIPMPPYRYGTTYTYTNSLICNDKVLVPIYGFDTDEEALRIYKRLLPGADVKGFDCSYIIGANGAIHCITKLMMKDPLVVGEPEVSTLDDGRTLVEVRIEAVRPVEEVVIVDGGRTVPMEEDGGGTWRAVLDGAPAAGWCVKAVDADGMYETWPEDAAGGE